MKDYGLVSIITPSYNSAAFIAQTIEAVLAQTYGHWEMLITDDNSTDDSCEVIQRYAARDPRIKLFRLRENSGAGVSRNNSIRQAKGRFLAFCDSDDRWYPEKLERQLAFMEAKGSTLSYSSYDVCTEEGEITGMVNCLPYMNRARILRDNGIGCLTAIYDTQKIEKTYMPVIRKRQDWCLWIDIISRCGRADGLQQPLAIYRKRKSSISSDKVAMLKWNYAVYHDFLKFSHLKSALYLGLIFLPYYFYKKRPQKISTQPFPRGREVNNNL